MRLKRARSTGTLQRREGDSVDEDDDVDDNDDKNDNDDDYDIGKGEGDERVCVVCFVDFR